MKFLIAGLGSIGRRHFRNLLALGERDILLYRTHKATLPDDELAGFPVETELEAALAYKPDAAIVANPTALHLDVAMPAAEAGCHLLLEKPVSHTLDGVDRLAEAVQTRGLRVLVGFQFRFHPGLQAVKRWIDSGQIGQPTAVRAHWGEFLPGWHPWEDYRKGYAALPELGGGVVRTLCHPLDYLRMLFGDGEVIGAAASSFGLGLPVEDTAEITLRFNSGVLGSVHLNYVQRPAEHWLEVVGTQGTIRWDNDDGVAHLFRAQANSWETVTPPAGFKRNTLFLDEMAHFLSVVHGEQQPVCSLADGVQALRFCLAALNLAG